jgi:hypothetical protein
VFRNPPFIWDENSSTLELTEFHATTDPKILVTHVWFKVVENYGSRSLSVQSDIFSAVSGIARRIAEKTGYTYRAGIWLEAALPLLLWQMYPTPRQSMRRTAKFLAPSWSWASLISIESNNSLCDRIYHGLSVRYCKLVGQEPELLSCITQPATADEFGSLKSAVIVLRGKLLDLGTESLRGWSRSDGQYQCSEGLTEIEWDEPMADCKGMFFLDMGRWKDTSHVYFCPGPDIIRFLVLRRVDGGEGVFKRVGVGYFGLESGLDKYDWIEKTLSII